MGVRHLSNTVLGLLGSSAPSTSVDREDHASRATNALEDSLLTGIKQLSAIHEESISTENDKTSTQTQQDSTQRGKGGGKRAKLTVANSTRTTAPQHTTTLSHAFYLPRPLREEFYLPRPEARREELKIHKKPLSTGDILLAHRFLHHALGNAEYFAPRAPMMRLIKHPSNLKDSSGQGCFVGVNAVLMAASGVLGAPSVTCCSGSGAETEHPWQVAVSENDVVAKEHDDVLVAEGANANEQLHDDDEFGEFGQFADLGQKYRLIDAHTYKPYACCYWAQPALHGIKKLQDRYPEHLKNIGEAPSSLCCNKVKLSPWKGSMILLLRIPLPPLSFPSPLPPPTSPHPLPPPPPHLPPSLPPSLPLPPSPLPPPLMNPA